MKTQLGLSEQQQRQIENLGKRIAEQQETYLKLQRECLLDFARVAGFESPEDAVQYTVERLQQDETASQMVQFYKSDWAEALMRIARKQNQDMANEEITAALDKLSL